MTFSDYVDEFIELNKAGKPDDEKLNDLFSRIVNDGHYCTDVIYHAMKSERDAKTLH